MDWLRIGAFALLILYHTGMAFVPWDWHVKASQPADWLTLPMLAVNGWRLGLLFMVSGYASGALMARSRPGAFAKTRTHRLLLPILFGMAMIVPAQPWVELMFKHGYADGFWHFLTRDYFRFGSLHGIVMPTWQHLWFVVYLWVYSLLLALGWKLGLGARLFRVAEIALTRWRLLALPIALLALRAMLIRGGETHDLFTDKVAHSLYPFLFLFGLLLQRSAQVRADVIRLLASSALIAMIGTTGVLGIEMAYPGDTRAPENVVTIFYLLRDLQIWGAILTLTGVALRWGHRDHCWRRPLSEAIFPFYIIHQTVTVLFVWYSRPLGWDAATAFAATVAATVLGCWLFYLVARSSGPLRPLFGLKALAIAPPPAKRER